MDNEIEKVEPPNHDEVLAAITSFNDPGIITNLFHQLGWTYSVEIKETIVLAQQNANLSIKFKAIKHLRELLREAAESAGYTASVSQTIPNAQGGQTTFHAKRIAGALNPAKKIEATEIKELQNDQRETRNEPNRESDRGQSKDAGTDTNSQFPPESGRGGGSVTDRDVEPGGTEPKNGGETSRPVPGGTPSGNDSPGLGDNSTGINNNSSRDNNNPCIQTRPPACNQDLYPGIASAGD